MAKVTAARNSYKAVWLFNYLMLFLSIVSFLNIKKWKILQLGPTNLLLNVLAIFFFLTRGLYELSELRESYLSQHLAEHFYRGGFNIAVRYVSYVFVAVLLYASFLYLRENYVRKGLKKTFDLLFHLSILWIASSELINWLDLVDFSQSYKLGLSILWGLYSLGLIGLGIWKKKKYLRIAAIILFAITLVKLFTYDISHLDTIPKTVVFVTLGILLLIISFLYNKFKDLIFDEG